MGHKIDFLSKVRENPFANDYAESTQVEHFWVKWRFEVLKKVVPAKIMQGKVFDIGCGNGIVRDQLEKSYSVDVSGCELDLTVLQRVKPGRGNIYYYDITERSPQLERGFSTVVLMDVLEHVAEPRQFLEAVRFHLKDTGSVVINVPAWPCLYSSFDKIQGHVKRYTTGDLRSELDAAGFDIVKITYWGMTLWPGGVLRKVFLRFFPEKEAFNVSYPSSPLVDFVMGVVMRMELLLGSCWPIGTSIMAVAVRRINT